MRQKSHPRKHFQNHSTADEAKDEESTANKQVLSKPLFIKPKRYAVWKNKKVEQWEYGVDFSPLKNEVAIKIKDKLFETFDNALDDIKSEHDGLDLARVSINHSNLTNAILVEPRPVADIDASVVMGKVARVLDSNEELRIDDSFDVDIAVMDRSLGYGKQAIPITNIAKDRMSKRSIVTIRSSKYDSENKYCFARAVVTALSRLNNEYNYKTISMGTNLQVDRAKRLHEKVQLMPPVSIDMVTHFENAIETNIIVFEAESGNKILRSSDKYSKNIYLFYHNNHYDVITKPAPFLGKSFFCEQCLKAYTRKGAHICAVSCFCGLKKCVKQEEVTCKECNRVCRSKECFESHKKLTRRNHLNKNPQSVCQRSKICNICKQGYKHSETHVCGEWTCTSCHEKQIGRHLCYLRAKMPNNVGYKYIDFDFETDQSTSQHVPNFVVAFKSCVKCIDTPTTEMPWCPRCQERETVFSGYQSGSLFGAWLFSKQHKGYTARAHNASGFDSMFILQYLTQNTVTPCIMFNGSKIVYLYVKELDIRIVDSCKFLPMKLSDLPKTFGLNEISKGYFPHFFNTPENQDYIGPYPQPSMYGVDCMKEMDRQAFYEWYALQTHNTFNFREEIYKYCKSDVDILQRACQEFRRLLIAITKTRVYDDKTKQTIEVAVDPFQSLTIASVAHAVFYFLCLPEDYYERNQAASRAIKHAGVWHSQNGATLQPPLQDPVFNSSPLGRVPAKGYYTKDKFSRAAIVWLEFIATSENIYIQHALNEGEMRIPAPHTLRVDGYDKLNNTIYEFYGCLWHGCTKCYPPNNKNPLRHPNTGKPLYLHYKDTQERENYLRDRGYHIRTIWEHENNRAKLENLSYAEFDRDYKLPERLSPRDAFYGGRTNAICQHYVAQCDEKMMYYDFTSLYGYILKYCPFPLGHPTVIVNNFTDIKNYFGLVKLDILPPRGLYFPVLPVKMNEKLLFPLCYTCSLHMNQAECHCSNEQRTLHGTWTTMEVQRALAKGYTIRKIYEIYHWEHKSDRLFTEYVDMFLKLKQEASGWPSWVKTDVDAQAYIDDYMRHENIKLDQSKINKNPGLRAVAKLMLNSFWGKFGQRDNFVQSCIISDPAELVKLMTDQSKCIEDFHVINEQLLHVSHRLHEDFVPENNSTNIYIAIFTTAHARLKLYDLIDRLGRRALYFDTDSVIFVFNANDWNPELGDYLGDLTDELPEGEYIVEFCGFGPKFYAYKTNKGNTVCKVRGFTLNYKNSQLVNFDALKEKVLNDETIETKSVKIRRDKQKQQIINREEIKICKKVFNKRVPDGDFSLPYGY